MFTGPIFKVLSGCPETAVNNYQHTLRNIPEDRRPQLHSDESLKYHTKETENIKGELEVGCKKNMNAVEG
jgi:hypothetical protein